MATKTSSGIDPRFVQRMQVELGSEAAAFFSALESDAPTSVLINPFKDPGACFGQTEPVPWCSTGRYLNTRPDFTFDPLFHAGCYYVMEASSMFVHHIVSTIFASHKPIVALDLCGAPGGKSVTLLSSLPTGSVLVSNEVSKSRFSVLQYNLDKWGSPNVVRTNLDPTRIPWTGLFDLILVDAPCSGEGLFRKDKDARAEWSPANVMHCSARQRRIIAEAERLLGPGGIMIYSTCTYSEDENMQQVQWMKSEFALNSKSIPIEEDWNITTMYLGNETGYQFYPHKVKGEGFFCAVMEKSNDAPAYEAPSKHRSREHNTIIVETKPPKALENWIQPNEQNGPCRFFESIDKEIYVLQSSSDHDWLSHGLVRYPGTELSSSSGSLRASPKGIQAGDRSVETPSHALALSNMLNPDLPSVELDRDQAIGFLRKDVIKAQSNAPGWNVARYNGYALGWLKHTQAGLKNYLPTKYRIIKQQGR